MSIVRDTVELLHRLRPPSMDDNGDVKDDVYRVQRYDMRVRQYRTVVFYWLLFISTVVAADVMFGWGLTPIYGGHAPRTTVDRIEIRLLEKDLLDTRVGQCTAADKSYFTDRLSTLRREYKKMTGEDWPIPECSELVQ